MYNLKIIKSGRRVEIFRINNYLVRKSSDIDLGKELLQDTIEKIRKELRAERKANKEPSDTKEKDRNRSLRDARNNIVRLLKSNDDMTTFITLTFSQEQDYKNSKKCLNNLFNKLRRDYNNLKYLWVLEYGDEKGRLHYHMLCNIPIKIKLSKSNERKSQSHKKLEQNFSKKYWKYGFVDIRELQQESNTNIALYVSAYITKSMQDKNLDGYRIYGYSHKTLNKPIVTTDYTRESIEEILKDFKNYKINFTSSYSIGYIDHKGEHIGNVNYYDLEENNNGNKFNMEQ